ncbi:DUF1648 domain-containing protein [Oceanobacillus bengalensis]|uniref:DUF1648 domain-containing protein n=1 Tax=Oceanobacillus bengalensis TaxID=1435466 RepID=A0A494Z6Z6_9BACI|nr:DUF1648 domain-containing protein [Oceanobacillus bengalensis]RKQ18323.1 DUF1648 domain-containing protein [Oceanobacillus bengalensis]
MNTFSNPILYLKRSKFEIVFDIISVVMLVVSIFYIIFTWSSIPSEVPGHYNFAGEVTRWDSKGMLFLLPIIGLITWIPLTFLERYPHVHNYIGLTEENAERLYRNSIRMINVLKNEMLLFFVILNFESVYVSKNTLEQSIFGGWDVAIFFIVVFGSLGYYIWKSFQLR